MSGLLVCIPSAGRPDHVAKYPALGPDPAILGGSPVWVVPADEADAYAAAGARVLPTGSREGAAHVRNAILEFAGDRVVAMVDDDVRKVEQVDPDTGAKWEVTVERALASMLDRLLMSDLRLIGAAPTANAYFTKRRTSVSLFAKSGLWVVRPSHLRLDTMLQVKEDYDFNLQHYATFGGWLRADDILLHSQQRTVSGGCAPLRAAGADQWAVNYLLGKWPGLVRKHATRAGEVSLTIPRRGK